MNLFAEINTMPGSLELGGWLLCAATLIAISNGAFKLVDRVKGREPYPPNAQLEQSYQHLTGRMETMEEKASQLTHTMMEQARKEAEDASERRQLIYAKIERLDEKLSGQLREQQVTLGEIAVAVARIEGRPR